LKVVELAPQLLVLGFDGLKLLAGIIVLFLELLNPRALALEVSEI
jgi:hypothetical protein